jgi:chromosome segregation ATPase
MSISSIERTDKVIAEVLLVLEELGRVDLVESLKDSIEDFNNRILTLVVENVNLDSCNTDLMLKINDLEKNIENLKGVIEDKATEIGDLEEVIGKLEEDIKELEEEISVIMRENDRLEEEFRNLRTGLEN